MNPMSFEGAVVWGSVVVVVFAAPASAEVFFGAFPRFTGVQSSSSFSGAAVFVVVDGRSDVWLGVESFAAASDPNLQV